LQLPEALAASQLAMNIVSGLDNDVARVIVYAHRAWCLTAAGKLSASQALLAEGYEIANRLNQPFFAAMAAVWAGDARFDVLDPADAGRWLRPSSPTRGPRILPGTARRCRSGPRSLD
jgi:hypothetical protein